MGKVISGQIFVVDDNIDTDQIIPAEYLTLVPSKPDEYEKLGSYAMIGLPDRYGKFIESGEQKTRYPIIIAGENFGCGSSRSTLRSLWGLQASQQWWLCLTHAFSFAIARLRANCTRSNLLSGSATCL